MALQFKEDSLYGFSYLAEKFQERPFFLKNYGYSDRHVAGGSFKFDYDPALCVNDVCNESSLEDIVIYFLHVRQYHYSMSFLPEESFNIVHQVILKIFERIACEIVPGDSIDLDTAMAAYNLITIFRDVVMHSYCILYRIKSTDTLQQNYESLDRFHHTLSSHITYGYQKKNPALEVLIASCSNLRYTLMDAIRIIKHNDLNSVSTQIVTNSKELTFLDVFVDNIDDPFFKDPLKEVTFSEDIVEISVYNNNSDIEFAALQRELSNRERYLKSFKSSYGNSMIDSHTLNNFKILQKLCGNLQISVSKNIEMFYKITNDFVKHYWRRRTTKTEQNQFILLRPEETQFIIQFTIQVLEYLKIVPKGQPEHEELVRKIFTEFGRILNSLRFMEIDDAITLKTSAILSKTLEELVTDLSVQYFIRGIPAIIKPVTTRITNYIGMVKKNQEYVSMMENTAIERFSLTDVKRIERIDQIPKIRRSRWMKLITEKATVGHRNQFYNQDMCPICYCEQKADDSCLLICKHTLCSSCTRSIVDRNKIPLCPVCRYPVCEFLPSDKLPKICR